MLQVQSNSLIIKCASKSKLRTFMLFNNFESIPDCILKPLPFVQSRAIAQDPGRAEVLPGLRRQEEERPRARE